MANYLLFEKPGSLIVISPEDYDACFRSYQPAGVLCNLVPSDFKAIHPAAFLSLGTLGRVLETPTKKKFLESLEGRLKDTALDRHFFAEDERAIDAALGTEKILGDLYVIRYSGTSGEVERQESEAYLVERGARVAVDRMLLKVNGCNQKLGPTGIGYLRQKKSGFTGSIRALRCGPVMLHRRSLQTSGNELSPRIVLLTRDSIDAYFSPRIGN